MRQKIASCNAKGEKHESRRATLHAAVFATSETTRAELRKLPTVRRVRLEGQQSPMYAKMLASQRLQAGLAPGKYYELRVNSPRTL